MANDKVIHGGLIIKGTLVEDATLPILTIDTDGTVKQRPAIDLSTLIGNSLAQYNILVGNSGGQSTAVNTNSVGDILADETNGLTIKAGVIVDSDINSSAAIAYSKLALTGSIVNADINASAGIVYSKLSLTGSIVNADINSSAGIARTKLASGNAYRILVNDASGVMSENVALTGGRAIVSDANGQLIVQTDGTTEEQVGYLSDVTGLIQNQLDNFIATKPVNAILKSPTPTEDGYAITWDNANGEWSLTDPVIQGIPVGGGTRQWLGKNSGTNYDASWLSLVLSDITDVTALAADLNLLTGTQAAGLTSTKILYLNDVNSPIQAQLDAKQSKTLAQNAIWVGNSSNLAAALPAGTEGYVLKITSGAPTWAAESAGSPPGSNTQMIFNDVGSFGTDTGFTYDKTTDTLTVVNLSTTTTIGGAYVYRVGGTDVAVADGGTNISSYTIGDLLYADGATSLAKLADISVGNALISGGVGAAPSWGKIGLTTHISGILAPANGGTGVANSGTITVSGNTSIGSSTDTVSLLTTGNTSVTLPTSGTLFGNPLTTEGDLIIGGVSGAPTRLGIGTNTYVLTSNGTTASWQPAAGGGSSVFSDLTAALATNNIDNANFAQTWRWNSLAGNSGLILSSNSTAAASNLSTLLEVNRSGANANANQTVYGIRSIVSNTGTGSMNVPIYASATGGTTNLAGWFENGGVLIGTGTLTSGAKLDIRGTGTSTGKSFRFADSGNTERVSFTDAGTFTVITTRGNHIFGGGWTANGDNNGLLSLGGTVSHEAVTARNLYGLRLSTNFNSASTNQITKSFAIDGTYTINNTGHTWYGIDINPTFAGSQVPSKIGLRITDGAVLIGGTTITADALLDLQSTTKAFIPPRMTTTQKNAIGTPSAGMILYDTDLGGLQLYTTSGWSAIGGGITNDWSSVSVASATITLPRNILASDNKYIGSAQITANKTIAFTGETNGDEVLFIFDIDAARTFTFPANTRMSDARWESSGANQLPLFDAGKYRMRAEFDGVDWWVEVTGPYS